VIAHNRISSILNKKDEKENPLFTLEVFYSQHQKQYIGIILPNDCSREAILHQFKSTKADNDAIFNFVNAGTAKWFPIALSDDPSKLYETLSVKLNKLTATSYNKLAEGIKLIGAAYRVPINKRIAQLNSRVPITISDLIDK